MDVYLVRHAIADKRDSERWPDDAERLLTPTGVARFRSAARGLRRIVPQVELVLASPYVRAWQTAEILERDAGWPAPERAPALEPDRPAREAVELLQRYAARSVALVGHEPHLSMLASLLMASDDGSVVLELKKGGAVLLAIDGDPAPGAARLCWSVSPKLLRMLG